MGFLSNLVKVFPSLRTRPLYLTGESYAGTYIVSILPASRYTVHPTKIHQKPYIMKTYFGLADPPVNIVKFAIGDGTIGSQVVYNELPTVWFPSASAVRHQFNSRDDSYPSLKPTPNWWHTTPRCLSISVNSEFSPTHTALYLR